MNIDKLKKLNKYLEEVQSRLANVVPEKHKESPETYKAFLKNEVRMTSLQIEKFKGV